MKLKIELHSYVYNCGDGCCTDYGTQVRVNGVEMDSRNEDAATIITEILTHLGHEVEVIETYHYDE